MTLLGLFGVLLGLLSYRVAFVRREAVAVMVFVGAYFLHVAAAIAYYYVALSSPADASLYYYDPYSMYADGFGFNTQFVIWVVQFIKENFGGSFLDYFLIFQAVGFWGVALLMKAFGEIYEELGAKQPIWVYGLLLFPSLQYWSSALGKDAPFFLAAVLTAWSAMNIHRRFIAFGAASILMLLIRPHLAALALASMSLAVILDRKTSRLLRTGLVVIAVAGMTYAVSATLQSLNIDLTSADLISDRIAARERLLGTEDAGTTVVTGTFLVRLLRLLFRPFFFDAENAMGFIASAENLILVVMLLIVLRRAGVLWALIRQVVFVRYSVTFFLALVLFLAFEYYNVGLGLRQKWTMIMPNFLVLFVALVAVAGARREAARGVAGGTRFGPDYAMDPAGPRRADNAMDPTGPRRHWPIAPR